MTWLHVVLAWSGFAKVLEEVPTGVETHSPEFSVMFRDGRRFRMSFHAVRES